MKKKKIQIGIIGTGNIGSDLLSKVIRSNYLECTMFTGQNLKSEGIRRAKKLGINTSYESIKAIQDNPESCEIVFDATSAKAHLVHSPILKSLNKFVIDLTPSRIGKMCIPIINMSECLNEQEINMVTCGGQATIPIIKAVVDLYPETPYVEIVGSIASKSAGIGTRDNIDEYTQTTRNAIEKLTNVPKAKAIIILNPANPPITMHNTVYIQAKKPNLSLVGKAINDVAKRMRIYSPGFNIVIEPIFDGSKITFMIEVVGSGDYLPAYAGNLDIINAAAIAAAETYARKKLLS
jgi:acetaldehyde dehydrogenase (acetylating)